MKLVRTVLLGAGAAYAWQRLRGERGRQLLRDAADAGRSLAASVGDESEPETGGREADAGRSLAASVGGEAEPETGGHEHPTVSEEISGPGLAVDHEREPGVPPPTTDDYDDIVDIEGAESFPASDPPSGW